MKTIFSLFFFFAIGLAVHVQQPEINTANEESADSVIEVVGWSWNISLPTSPWLTLPRYKTF